MLTVDKNNAPTSEEPRVLRELGYYERYRTALSQSDLYRGTLVACRYHVAQPLATVERHSDLVDLLERAIARTTLEYPLLQVGMAEGGSQKPLWVRLESLDLREHIEWQFTESDADCEARFQNTLRSQVDFFFAESDVRPGWRVVVQGVKGGNYVELIFTFSHCHCDGISAKIFQETLIQGLNHPDDGDALPLSNHILALSTSAANFPPPPEKICDFPVTPGHIVKSLGGEIRRRLWPGLKLNAATWAPIRQPSTFKTQNHIFYIDPARLSGILAACRLNNTTLTGLMHAVVLFTFVSALPGDKATAFECATPLDMRRYLPHTSAFDPVNSIANLVSSMSHNFDAGLVARIRNHTTPGVEFDIAKLDAQVIELLWTVAARVRVEIQERLELGRTNDIIGLLKFVPDWYQHIKEKLEKPRQVAWVVSNLGVMGVDGAAQKETDWGIDRAVFCLSGDVPGPALGVSLVAVKGKELCVNCSWQHGAIPTSLEVSICSKIEAWLQRVGEVEVIH